MIERIRRLEAIARQLEPDNEQREQLLRRVAGYSQDFLEGIAEAPAYNASADGRGLYDSPIGEEGIDIDEALSLLSTHVDTVGINPTSGRFLGYIPGGALFPSALGDYLAAVADRYAGIYFAAPGAVRMENMLISWMAGAIGYPAGSAGNLTSGGSIANLIGIVTARDTFGIKGDLLPRSVIYFTEHIHHSVEKAIHVAGLSDCVQRRVPVDGRYRMEAGALEQAIRSDRENGLNPWLIVASAGTTNTGSVDPLAAIAAIAAEYQLWFHLDGAYGAFFVLCPEGKAMLGDMKQADSLVMDPHKTLFLPYGTGALLVKDGSRLYSSQNWAADYMQDIYAHMDEVSPADLSPELTKHFRGLRLWLPLKLFGLAPFRAALSEKIHLARYFHERIQTIDGFEAGPYPDLSVVTYRYRPPRGDADVFNARLTKRIQQHGRVFISSTRVSGQFVLRLAISSFRTHLADIEEAVDILQSMAKQLVNES